VAYGCTPEPSLGMTESQHHRALPTSATADGIEARAGRKKGAARAWVGKLSPPDLRRFFVDDALDSGVDIATVAAVVRHSHVSTTRSIIDEAGRQRERLRGRGMRRIQEYPEGFMKTD
jgi:integrase